jgi:hypothetical protein
MQVNGPPNYPREGGSLVSPSEISSEGPKPFFPPVCLQTHWDPTAIIQRTLPTEYIPQALDPRPWAKICLEYVTSGENGPGPKVPDNVVLSSSGGDGPRGPANRYSQAIDNESKLRRLDRPLGKCDDEQYTPNENGDMYNSRVMAPRIRNTDPRIIAETSFPKVLLNFGQYDCRQKNDELNISLSSHLFNNATKQDKYKLKGKV